MMSQKSRSSLARECYLKQSVRCTHIQSTPAYNDRRDRAHQSAYFISGSKFTKTDVYLIWYSTPELLRDSCNYIPYWFSDSQI
jgi:hypothetical protein